MHQGQHHHARHGSAPVAPTHGHGDDNRGHGGGGTHGFGGRHHHRQPGGFAHAHAGGGANGANRAYLRLGSCVSLFSLDAMGFLCGEGFASLRVYLEDEDISTIGDGSGDGLFARAGRSGGRQRKLASARSRLHSPRASQVGAQLAKVSARMGSADFKRWCVGGGVRGAGVAFLPAGCLLAGCCCPPRLPLLPSSALWTPPRTHAHALPRASVFRVMPAQSYENIAAYRDFLEERSAAAAKGAPPMTAGVRAEMERLRTSASLEARQNEDTVKKLHGTEVMYGQAVQLLHVRSGKYLTARSRRLSTTEKECTLLELDMDGDEHSLFNLLPRYKHRR